MNCEHKFIDLVQQALRLTQTPIWLDHVINQHHLVTFEDAPAVFLIAHKPSTPRELAVQLAIRQIECDAFSSFCVGFEQAQAKSTGVMQ